MHRNASIVMICPLPGHSCLRHKCHPTQLRAAGKRVGIGGVRTRSDVRAQWTDDRRFIESVVTIEVLRGMKGGARESIAFTVPGGQVGRYLNVIPGAPSFAQGDLAVFFLTARGARLPVTTGLTQGIYRVQRDAASGEMLVVPPIAEGTGRIVRGDLRRKPVSLAAFESSVRAALRLAQGRPERSRGTVAGAR